MKKLGSLCVILIMLMTIVGCSKDNGKENSTSGQSSNSMESESTKLAETEGDEINIEESTNDDGSQKIISKQEYLDSLQYAYDLEDNIQAANTQMDMNIASAEALTAWDEELNKIYGLLRDKLSESDMENLKTEELQWIKKRDDEVEKIGKQFAGGSMESFQRSSTSLGLTKQRTLELIDLYFDK